ncbi:MAG TPA: hypothetical protein VJK51_01840 [Candidatus Nanoarchaeia archaeon]|nr:hypothetical protein [Candidatus Nanoarchaeia archaeon]
MKEKREFILTFLYMLGLGILAIVWKDKILLNGISLSQDFPFIISIGIIIVTILCTATMVVYTTKRNAIIVFIIGILLNILNAYVWFGKETGFKTDIIDGILNIVNMGLASYFLAVIINSYKLIKDTRNRKIIFMLPYVLLITLLLEHIWLIFN